MPAGGRRLVAFADFIGGFALWVDGDGTLHHTYQYLGVETYRQSSTEPIPTGDVTLTMHVEADDSTPGSGGEVMLLANGSVVALDRRRCYCRDIATRSRSSGSM